MLLRASDVLALVQKRRKLGAMVLVLNEREGFEHGSEAVGRFPGLVSQRGELLEVPFNLAFMPGGQDRFDAWKVFVERCSSDASLGGNLRHRDRPQPVLGYELRRGFQNRVAHLAAVRLDGFVPELRHQRSIHDAAAKTWCIDRDSVYRKMNSVLKIMCSRGDANV